LNRNLVLGVLVSILGALSFLVILLGISKTIVNVQVSTKASKINPLGVAQLLVSCLGGLLILEAKNSILNISFSRFVF
jgi:hypothetical protein